jgi:hypothetical protein
MMTIGLITSWIISLVCITGLFTLTVRSYERERRKEQENRKLANDNDRKHYLELFKSIAVIRAEAPAEAAYAVTALDQPEPTPQEELPPPVTGIKLKGGEEVDFLVGDYDDIVNGADEDQLLREQ